MQHFVLSIAPFAETEAQIHWSSFEGAIGYASGQLISELAKALEEGSATLGVSIYDDGSEQFAVNSASKGMRLVQEGSLILGEIISSLRDAISYHIYVGSDDFTDEQANLLIWQVQRNLAAPAVEFSTIDWGERAFRQIKSGLKDGNLTDWREKSLPISVVAGALYRASWSDWVDYSENMVVIEV